MYVCVCVNYLGLPFCVCEKIILTPLFSVGFADSIYISNSKLDGAGSSRDFVIHLNIPDKAADYSRYMNISVKKNCIVVCVCVCACVLSVVTSRPIHS